MIRAPQRHTQLCIVRGMRTTQAMLTFRTSVFTIVAGSLVLASCVSMDGAGDDEDQLAEELDGTPQLPHAAVCNGGRFSCKAHIRVDDRGRIALAATPSGL